MTNFTKESFEFLSDLEINNNKKWFIDNKSTYESHLIAPLKELISNLGMFIMTIDDSLETKPVINKAISRIYRDTRYSKNKLPFKNNIGFNFRRKFPSWKFHPAFLLRITPHGYVFGLTIAKNTPGYFENFRNDLDNNPKSFQKAIKQIITDKDLEVCGEDYKKFIYQGSNRHFKPFYSKKNLFVRCCRSKNHYSSEKELILDIQQKFMHLAPAYNYFNDIFSKDLG